MVLVDLTLAAICFLGSCHPALVGENTPSGVFSLSWRETAERGYGGDLLVFHEDQQHLWAIHRVYTLRVEERRVERLESDLAPLRRSVTRGCVNVKPDVYQRLVDCCRNSVLVIVGG